MNLREVKVGDRVTRLVGDQEIPHDLRVTKVTDSRIVCGPYEFDITTGGEIDEGLGSTADSTGSRIVDFGD